MTLDRCSDHRVDRSAEYAVRLATERLSRTRNSEGRLPRLPLDQEAGACGPIASGASGSSQVLLRCALLGSRDEVPIDADAELGDVEVLGPDLRGSPAPRRRDLHETHLSSLGSSGMGLPVPGQRGSEMARSSA
jgi:hypothetical protein